MALRWKGTLKDRDVTDEALWLNRRALLGGAAGLGLMGIAGGARAAEGDLEPNSWEEITTYNNYYEFGTGKSDPASYAYMLTTQPWSVTIDGLVDRPGDYSLEQILGEMTIEQRIYRFRCVEAWSMVIPWNGFELADLLEMAGVQDGAKYVAFETVLRREEMPGTRYPILDWPYVEGLRLDEAMHPLAILAVGMYGKTLLNQQGPPLRLVVPWKYGFKSIKSIVKIRFQEERPKTTWEMLAPQEYGFYANVNPEVDHPRWSQKRERRLPSGLLSPNYMETVKFNGYGEQVADLYKGMDLSKFY